MNCRPVWEANRSLYGFKSILNLEDSIGFRCVELKRGVNSHCGAAAIREPKYCWKVRLLEQICWAFRMAIAIKEVGFLNSLFIGF